MGIPTMPERLPVLARGIADCTTQRRVADLSSASTTLTSAFTDADLQMFVDVVRIGLAAAHGAGLNVMGLPGLQSAVNAIMAETSTRSASGLACLVDCLTLCGLVDSSCLLGLARHPTAFLTAHADITSTMVDAFNADTISSPDANMDVFRLIMSSSCLVQARRFISHRLPPPM